VTIKRDHSAKNAIKNLYLKKYSLDKQFQFKIPRLKLDMEAYLNILLRIVDEAFDEGVVVKYKGHELKWPSRNDKEEPSE
jgi:hypothetical protein